MSGRIHIFIIKLLLLVIPVSAAYAHSVGPNGIEPLDWHTDQISRVFTLFTGPGIKETKKISKIEKKHCMSSHIFGIDVLDQYAYDIDEAVEVEVEFDLKTSANGADVTISYDKNGSSIASKKITLPKNSVSRWYKHTFTLERARFSGRSFKSMLVADLSIGSKEVFSGPNITICSIKLNRSYSTPLVIDYGRLRLTVLDERGNIIPGRVGIYDNSGRMPPPGDEAIPVNFFFDRVQATSLQSINTAGWPSKSRYAFYVDGNYQTRLPPGRYDLMIWSGPDYRIYKQSILIEKGKETAITAKLFLWKKMSAQGWYSGDTHVHIGRNSELENHNISLQAQAEGLNVTNLLQVGNNTDLYFRQYAFGKKGRYGEIPYSLVSGLEDPRTFRLGHAVQVNIAKPVRDEARYYQYHEAFDHVHQQGGLSGYAHVGNSPGYPGTKPGLALTVPYGLIDFIELWLWEGSDIWFDFLNLGYKLPVAAGTDYPYGDVIGVSRTYVNTGQEYSVQRWFDGLKAGRTFVTGGPVLDMTINNQGIGSELNVTKGTRLTIDAKASINPDIDLLDRIELYQQGEIIATVSSEDGAEELFLKHELIATEHGSWFVLAARGKLQNSTEAITTTGFSSPIYVYVNGKGFCNLSEVSSLATSFKAQMASMIAAEQNEVFEAWNGSLEARNGKYWLENKKLLEERVENTGKEYDKLVELAEKGACISDKD